MLSVLITIFIVLLVVGAFCWAIQYIPGLPPPVKNIITIFICLVALIWIVAGSGLLGSHAPFRGL